MSEIIERIQRAYAADQERGFRKVHRASELPRSYEELTPEWMTDALSANAPSVQVASLELGPVDNGSSNRRRLFVTYKDAKAAAGLPTSFFCKASHDLANRLVLGTSQGAQCETDFYTYVRPHLSIESPVAYFAQLDTTSFNSLIILGDLTGKVESFCDHKTPINRRRAESQMRLLGHMHGAAYSRPEIVENLDRFSSWPEYFKRTLGFGMESGTKKGIDGGRDVMPARLRSVPTDRIWALMQRSVDLHNDLPLTFMHGDVHLKNWYVAGNDQMGLSDWQCCGRGHWARDVCYTISTALTVEDRRAWENDLLRLYLDELRANGGPNVGFDEAWLHYRQQLLTALTWWAVTLCPPEGLPDMQPKDTTLEFIRRITAAMDDVDSVGAFA